MDRDWIEVMQLLATLLQGDDEAGFLEHREMLHHRLACHVMPLAKLAQVLPIACMKPVEQLAPDRIGERLEHCIHAHGITICNLLVTCQVGRGTLAVRVRSLPTDDFSWG